MRCFIEQADELGVLVMVNGVVGNNNHRKLDPEEFRGFALADNLAPLIFINGSDSKAAKMFTLAHELAHIWLGQSALSDAGLLSQPSVEMERWCNSVAAEILVPRAVLEAEYRQDTDVRDEANRLARRFKVSQLVILRRIHDIGGITQEEYGRVYQQTLEQIRDLTTEQEGGGNFYLYAGSACQQTLCPGAHRQHARRPYPSSGCISPARFLETRDLSPAWAEPGSALMAYLLDANVFIQAKNLHYGFDFCPAFWDWLVAQQRRQGLQYRESRRRDRGRRR